MEQNAEDDDSENESNEVDAQQYSTESLVLDRDRITSKMSLNRKYMQQ